VLTITDMAVQRGGTRQGYGVSLPSLSLKPGEVAALTGPSGCGKSTLLEMIGLILRPDRLAGYCLGPDRADAARPLLAGDQDRLSALRARRLGFVLQNGGLLPYLSVEHNIHLPRRMLGMPLASAWVDKAVAHLGLTPLLQKMPRQLSIGERQRVAFVRAIAHQPQLLLADEPTAALDPHTARQLFALMLEMVDELNISALVVSHDWQLVDAFHIRRLHGRPQGDRGSVFESQ